ncbi:hypothetical protein llap_12847 [Limosa lapponica baueri]|uniref:Uncharacterized protein n=1 Tax=Limosa lapponica baueri TaxID=1758121 RepID=A0A2I0TSR0_LIMLA|nr:hypothetical protein llap_12847 [Limosa lapponica baueri]
MPCPITFADEEQRQINTPCKNLGALRVLPTLESLQRRAELAGGAEAVRHHDKCRRRKGEEHLDLLLVNREGLVGDLKEEENAIRSLFQPVFSRLNDPSSLSLFSYVFPQDVGYALANTADQLAFITGKAHC